MWSFGRTSGGKRNIIPASSCQRPRRAFSSEGGSRRKLQMHDCQLESRFALWSKRGINSTDSPNENDLHRRSTGRTSTYLLQLNRRANDPICISNWLLHSRLIRQKNYPRKYWLNWYTGRTILPYLENLDTDVKIILLNHQNNAEANWIKYDEQCCKKFWHSRNWLERSTKLFW